ncbi:hypothetical protein NDU88_004273 [Pleurodeles waltl]|uniref:Uncharacterized protein n=1 Tax=Pleurodeles waltl TaxID=8319 RepID=A0AAV7V0Q3_PLEWA|nr:hypothetical protein NDU88_004273 [Pleurodeles waltl]
MHQTRRSTPFVSLLEVRPRPRRAVPRPAASLRGQRPLHGEVVGSDGATGGLRGWHTWLCGGPSPASRGHPRTESSRGGVYLPSGAGAATAPRMQCSAPAPGKQRFTRICTSAGAHSVLPAGPEKRRDPPMKCTPAALRSAGTRPFRLKKCRSSVPRVPAHLKLLLSAPRHEQIHV